MPSAVDETRRHPAEAAVPSDDVVKGLLQVLLHSRWHVFILPPQIRLEARQLIGNGVASHGIDIGQAQVERLGDSAPRQTRPDRLFDVVGFEPVEAATELGDRPQSFNRIVRLGGALR